MLERDTFAFLPMIGSDVVLPINDVTRIKVIGHTYTETTQGSIVTRTRDDGETVSWERDSSGHLVMSDDGIRKRTWEYDGDVITATTVEGATRRYHYDGAGNVVTVTSDNNETRERYDYSCW